MLQKDFILPVLTALIFICCNIGAKLSVEPNKEWLIYLVYIGAAAAYWIFRKVCMDSGLAIASGKIDSLVSIFSIIFGLLILHEQVTAKQSIGLMLLLVGLYLIK